MIVDEAFFGLSRTGTLDGSFRYPGILNSRDINHISLKGNDFMVLGQYARPVTDDKNESSFQAGTSLWATDDIVVIPNGADLIQRPRRLIERLLETRSGEYRGKLIYLQGVSDPYLIPVLVYAGVSIFDDSTLRIEAQRGIKYTILGREAGTQNNYENNVNFVQDILEVIGNSIGSGSVREIVEKYQISSKALELLRLLDNDGTGLHEMAFPRRTAYIKANSLESLRRPDLVRYRDYIASEYLKPQNKEIALLIPCSARKPYSTSKSHRRIIDALSGLRNQLHEIIVTSPVGVVPRDLENTYPANSYDIPVIGDWYEDEKLMIKSLLNSYFSRNSYVKVIAFITDDLLFIKEVLPPNSEIIIWDKAKTAISELREKIKEISGEIGKPAIKTNQRLETFTKIAQYQFGNWIGPYLEGCKIVRNYNTDMLVKEGKPVLVFNDRLGKFTINKASAAWFVENSRFMVEIDDFKPTANIYSVGVLDVTGDVRQEDEVVLHHKGDIRGVGIAKMPGDMMVALRKGTSVKVRN